MPIQSGQITLATLDGSERMPVDTGGAVDAVVPVSVLTEYVISQIPPSPAIRFESGEVTTTGAAQTPLLAVSVPLEKTLVLDGTVAGRRSGGLAGDDGDSAGFGLSVCVKNIAGVITLLPIVEKYGMADQDGWNATFTLSGTDIVVSVTGAADNTIDWLGGFSVFEVP